MNHECPEQEGHANNRIRNLLRDRKEALAESKDFKRPQQRELAPDEAFDKIWIAEHLKHCLKLIRTEIEESTFQAFHQHVIEHRPVEEVCKELSMTPNQVYKIKARVTRKLAAKMKELLYPSE